MFVLDTNVISELRHGKPHQSAEVRAWAAGQPSSKLFLSAITILELEIGIQALERRMPPQGSALRAWLAGVRVGVSLGDTLACAARGDRRPDGAAPPSSYSQPSIPARLWTDYRRRAV